VIVDLVGAEPAAPRFRRRARFDELVMIAGIPWVWSKDAPTARPAYGRGCGPGQDAWLDVD
jgi:hypothetical protein